MSTRPKGRSIWAHLSAVAVWLVTVVSLWSVFVVQPATVEEALLDSLEKDQVRHVTSYFYVVDRDNSKLLEEMGTEDFRFIFASDSTPRILARPEIPMGERHEGFAANLWLAPLLDRLRVPRDRDFFQVGPQEVTHQIQNSVSWSSLGKDAKLFVIRWGGDFYAISLERYRILESPIPLGVPNGSPFSRFLGKSICESSFYEG